MAEPAHQRDFDAPPDYLSERMTLNLGPSHPASHGTLQVVVDLDGETIARAIPIIGYLHRSYEKLGEAYTYHQFINITDRMCYTSSFIGNVGWSLAVEKLLGVEAPPRAQAVRLILSELSRVMDHIVCIGINAVDIGAFTVFLHLFNFREKAYDILEACCGARLTTTYTRIGGLSEDTPPDFQRRILEFCDTFPETLDRVEKLLDKNRIWLDRTIDVGVITQEDALASGWTGPCLRATGLEWDLRREEPYLGYDQYDFDIPTRPNGDVFDRYLVRMAEMRESLKIMRQAVEDLPSGPVILDDYKNVLPAKADVHGNIEGLIHHFKIVMHSIEPPVGEVYSCVEGSNGELGFYVVSDGTGAPYRVHVRAPCFHLYQSFPELTKGGMIADAIAVLGSLNVIAGELDR